AYTTVTVKNDKIVVTTKQINGFVLDSFTIEDKNASSDTSEDQIGENTDTSTEASDGSVSADPEDEISENTEASDGSVSDTSEDQIGEITDEASDGSVSADPEDEKSGSFTIIVICVIAFIVLAVGAILFIKRKK
ncbi:MAG: hypothetical protein J6Q72_06650, partial [Clostridia bacterium]|nr:hypothetical protein [Clostridia bacterium]